MNKLIPLSNLFNIDYGNGLDLTVLEYCDDLNNQNINYVSRTRENNGISAKVKKYKDVEPFKAGLITVAGSGNSVLESFIQPEPFYTGYHVFILEPLSKMTDLEKLFYCFCIRQNQYKYNFGRQANRTLKDILVPASIPKEFATISLAGLDVPKPTAILSNNIELQPSKWKAFELQKLFTIKKGKRLTKEDMTIGRTPFVAAIDSNNGYREFIGQSAIHTGNTITVNYNGSVGEAFYQALPFWASDDVNVLYPKFNMNVYIALFIVTIIRQEQYRYNYGRKWHATRMANSTISLPVKNGQPDYEFMENYMKSLPFSSSI